MCRRYLATDGPSTGAGLDDFSVPDHSKAFLDVNDGTLSW
jgi:hypothetical protein